MPRPSPAHGLLLLALSGACTRAEPLPSVVLITCDTLRRDRLGTYGCTRDTSPNLDALAGEALVFEQAWSTAPLTGPALSGLMTGRLPQDMGIENNRRLLPAGATTLAERLAAAGMETAAVVSNWVLRSRPELGDVGLAQGFAHYDEAMDSVEAARTEVRERLAPRTTDAALAWLDARPRASFFLWVHYQDPHGPYTPPQDCVRAEPASADAEKPLEVGADSGLGVLPSYQAVDGARDPATYRARYEGEIRYFDRELGRLVQGLRERGILERALLVFSADHGESLGEHGYWFSHGQNLHGELLRVPLLVRAPGARAVPRRVATPVSHLDVFPTVLGFLGLEGPALPGRDLLAPDEPSERVLPQAMHGAWAAATRGRRLIVEHDLARLFDLDTDPDEEHDLAAEHPEQVEALTRGRAAFVERVPLAPLEAVRARPSPEEARGLEALGYAGSDAER